MRVSVDPLPTSLSKRRFAAVHNGRAGAHEEALESIEATFRGRSQRRVIWRLLDQESIEATFRGRSQQAIFGLRSASRVYRSDVSRPFTT